MNEKTIKLNEKNDSIFIPYQKWINVNTKDKIIEKILRNTDLSIKYTIMEYLFYKNDNTDIINVDKIIFTLVEGKYISDFKIKNKSKIKIKLFDVLLEETTSDIYKTNSKNLTIKIQSRDTYEYFLNLMYKICKSLSSDIKFVYIFNNFNYEIPICGRTYARYESSLFESYDFTDPYNMDLYNVTISINKVIKNNEVNILVFDIENIIKIEN